MFPKNCIVNDLSLFEIENEKLLKYNGCNSIVIIPYTVTAIEQEAFAENCKINYVKIHKNVNYIDITAFYLCKNLVAINVSAYNSNYASMEGILYNKDFTELLIFPNGINNNFTFPNTLKKIGEFSCVNCQFAKLDFKNTSLIDIEAAAFMGCINLKYIYFPVSLKDINKSAFSGCKIEYMEFYKSSNICYQFIGKDCKIHIK